MNCDLKSSMWFEINWFKITNIIENPAGGGRLRTGCGDVLSVRPMSKSGRHELK